MKDSNKTKDQLIKELMELRRRITQLERTEIGSSLSDVFDALKKISSGDPTVRIEETSGSEFFSKLKHMVNMTAENIGEIVDLSHEFAMVLAELFDVMHKVSKGNYNARVSGSSQIELLESLKNLTNDMIGSISKEITERNQMENVLKEREERYRELFETVTDAVLVHYVSHDKPGKFIAANESACKMFGYTADEFLQIEINKIDVPEQAEKIPAILEKLFKDGHALFETEHVTKDRRRIPVEVNIRLFDFRGQPAVLSVVRDITERKQAKKIIDDALTFNKTIIEASPIGIITYKASGQCVSANESIAKMVGATVDQLLKQNFYHLESWKKSGMLELAEEALAKGIEKSKDVYVVSTFEKEGWFSCRFIPFQYGDEPHLLTLFADITDRKKAEKEIRRRIKELEEFYDIAIGREMRMEELKEQMEEMKEEMKKLKNELEKYKKP